MDIYEWMRVVTSRAGLAEPVERDALELVDQLETRSVLGTMAGATDVTGHAPVCGWMSTVCEICHKEHEQ